MHKKRAQWLNKFYKCVIQRFLSLRVSICLFLNLNFKIDSYKIGTRFIVNEWVIVVAILKRKKHV